VINVLIWLLVLLIVAGVIYMVLQMLPIAEPYKRAVLVVFTLIICLIALAKLLPQLGYSL